LYLLKLVFLILVLGLASCVPQQSTSNKRKSSTGSTTQTDDNQDDGFSNAPDASSVAFFTGSSESSNVTLNEDLQTVIYLKGSSVHDFLGINSNQTRTFCLVASFNTGGAVENLRMRAVPISFFDFQKQSTQRLLRIDVPESTTNQSACSGSAFHITNSANGADTADNSSLAFDFPNVCISCAGIISSTDISLYLSNSGITTIDRVSESQLSLSSLVLRIDSKNNSSTQTGGENSCTDTGCRAKGFDCCLDGQCANDGEQKPSASSEDNFAQALADIAQNPSAFVNYPNVFFVCGANPVIIATPTPLPDAQATSDIVLEQQVQSFLCLEEAKKESPDFATAAVCAPNFDQTSFEAVRSAVWRSCGCDANPFPTSPSDPECPDFGLDVVKNQAGTITSVFCVAPPPPADPTPFQNLSLAVSNRSAPHRFFRADTGAAVDDISTLSSTVEPEGTPFVFLDPSSKTPEEESVRFNMNAILGQFSLELNLAQPAKVVQLDFDQAYIITTLSSFYTPCPQCSNDNWFQSFTAYPSSSNGTGLQAVSYTTDRQSFSDNNTLGNYEDTVFGRACWVPPTMIPFTHRPNSVVETQRQDRLLTQAMLYNNGYQKDWYGFNKGALIGSFDGVTWFAIGKSRRVIASSDKLFLAINAPFADLADPNDTVVQVIVDLGNNVVPDFDFDPAIAPNDNRQNSGATCQFWHQCQTDTDCVTRLGWEYMCADTDDYRSHLPKFDVFASEKANEQFEATTFDRLLQGLQPPSDGKRCVYRGSGAICNQNFSTLGGFTDSKKKLFTCAPNFYCAGLDDKDYNASHVRNPSEFDLISLGKETNVLGRPLKYIDGDDSLPLTAQSNLLHNAAIFFSGADLSATGVCRPGKKLGVNSYLEQHRSNDSTGRTDYINQISSCNSDAIGSARHLTCPEIQMTDDETISTARGDYVFYTGGAGFDLQRQVQNACGGESLHNNTGVTENTFAQIEADPIKTIVSLVTPQVTRDACFRRAGSVCHTDLDCSPGPLHGQEAIFFGIEFFGGTDAEKLYWEESLVCAQGAERPRNTDEGFFDFDMSLNRCCREIGKDFTMFTQTDSATIIPDSLATNISGNLDTDTLPLNNPLTNGRYSRYSVANVSDLTTPINLTTPSPQTPVVTQDTTVKAFQWKTFNDTGEKTCCGGGWVRKFADGTHDWTDNTRLSINTSNFSCLNYSTEVITTKPIDVAQINYSRDLDKLCVAPADGGCVQNAFIEPSDTDNIIAPTEFALDSVQFAATQNPLFNGHLGLLNTTPLSKPSQAGVLGIALDGKSYYEPTVFPHRDNSLNPVASDQLFTHVRNPTENSTINFTLPIYISANLTDTLGSSNLVSVKFLYFQDDGTNSPIQSVETLTPAPQQGIPVINGGGGLATPPIGCSPSITDGQDLAGTINIPSWCIDNQQGQIVYHANLGTVLPTAGTAYAFGSVEIQFHRQGSLLFDTDLVTVQIQADVSTAATVPGNDLYYLTRFGRLELLGVPQIAYEPIFCNDNRDNLVSGIYNVGSETRSSFFTNSFAWDNTINGRFLSQMYDETFDPGDASIATPGEPNDTSLLYNIQTSLTLQADSSDIAGLTSNDTTTSLADNGERAVFQDKISLNPIFSGHEFTCCNELGDEVSSAARCCSNHAVDVDGKLTCRLTKGVNLNVYFNKFISSEGLGEELPGGGLEEADFIPETGEPKLSDKVNDKLRALGEAFCENGAIRKGGAFGFFLPEPNNGFFEFFDQGDDIEDAKRYSIIDSFLDIDADNNTGTAPFLSGFRWDHHTYCD
jgi:hypothetical protein